LWIAFAVGSSGTVIVDEGARTALQKRGVSLLPAGVIAVEGTFDADSAVELAGPDGRVFAKGLTKHPASVLKELAGRRTSELPPDVVHEVVHRDDLVLLP
jgi:glutamate 5-kinase